MEGAALSGLIEKGSEYLEYWREHKGEEIVIRQHALDPQDQYEQSSYLIRGTVSDVLSLPPGFVLVDVREMVSVSKVSVMWGPDSTEPLDTVPGHNAEEVVREVDEKFVAFSKIEELEKAEHYDNATEPFREDQ